MKNIEETEQEKNIDIKKIFFRALNYWYIFLICVVLTSTYAVYSYLTTTPIYKIGTKVMIGRDNSAATGVGGGSGQSIMPTIVTQNSYYENQYIILTSRRQVERTLRQLDFEISYYMRDRYREIEIYKNSPFRVIIDSTTVKPGNLSFDIHFMSKDQFRLSLTEGEFSQEVKFFEKVNHPRFAFTIVPVEENIASGNYVDGIYRFAINTMDRLTGQYQRKIQMSSVTGGSTVVELSIQENNVQKGMDFLNKLAQASCDYTLDRKNYIATNTITFIEKQLAGAADSLGVAENVLEDFRTRNAVMDVSLQGQTIMTRSRELESQREALRQSLNYYDYLQRYLEENKSIQDMIAPSSQGIDDPSITGNIAELMRLNTLRAQELFNSSPENPNVVRMNSSIDNLKRSIIETIKMVKNNTQSAMDDINNRIMALSGDMRKLPKTEQAMANIQRKYMQSEGMYNFLMQKRSDAQLAKAGNMPDNEIIEEALPGAKIAPDLNKTIMLILIGGLVIPLVIVFLTIFMNDKVLDIEDIKSITSLSIIGQIPFEQRKGGKKKKAIFSSDQPNTVLAESFRSVRVSIGFYAKHKTTKTILVTSTLPGEGKSFCSINLAHSFAQLGKKVILVEFDMRRPSVGRQLGIKPETGLSHYFTGEKSIDNVIHKDTGIPNFHIIFSGQIPPNPSELIASEDTAALITTLQNEYEIVIIDTPPLGLVADAHLLTSYSDVNLLVIKHNSTPKPVLRMNLKEDKTKNTPNLAIILNGVMFRKREYNYQYGYDMKNKYITRQA
ncbi:MAG: formate--tetrahydrofolate ligase [Cytophagaceae bacterium]|jgi:capsular exopolysaccharide synthesis family protein|nr:formate--tetrahydrofolate ligase [Cytophagaceae bacterium]